MLHGEQHPDRVEAHQLAPQEATSRQLYRDTPALSPLQDLRTAHQLLPVYEPNTLRLASSSAASVAACAASSLSRRATYYEPVGGVCLQGSQLPTSAECSRKAAAVALCSVATLRVRRFLRRLR
jgi:hypothetical protein